MTVVCHVPHSAVAIPEDVREQLLLSERELEAELATLTDWYTDELFDGAVPGASVVRYPVSRLVVDPERFPHDADEPAASVGMGVIYERTADGRPLRRPLSADERLGLLEKFYWPHHRRLERAVEETLSVSSSCLVLDCHSFPRRPFPTERGSERPDICLGTDEYHTPPGLVEAAVRAFEDEGFDVGVNNPFSGTLVPSRHYRTDGRVMGLMVEVGRWLYMDEDSLERVPSFHAVRLRLRNALQTLTARVGG